MKRILFLIALIAFSCQNEPEVKVKPGKVYTKDQINVAKDPIPPGWCVVPGGGGYILVRC